MGTRTAEHLDGGTDEQITVRPCEEKRYDEDENLVPYLCDVCEQHDVDEPGDAVIELVDGGRNWLSVLGKDVLYLCDECARQHSGELLRRIEQVLDEGALRA